MRSVEMRCDERLAAVDNLFAISFESIRRVVESDLKQDLDEVIGQSVTSLWVINRTATAHEAAPKDTVIPLIKFLHTHNVAAIVRFSVQPS